MLNRDVPDPTAAFGFGRRTCPGRYFADASIWAAIVSILSVYDISKAVDKDGVEIVPSEDVTPGMLSCVARFKIYPLSDANLFPPKTATLSRSSALSDRGQRTRRN